MTISEMYNALEKAIDTGKSTLENRVYFLIEPHNSSNVQIVESLDMLRIDSDGDLIFTSYD